MTALGVFRLLWVRLVVLFTAGLVPFKMLYVGPSRDFRWISSHTDAALFESIKQAFASELQPDDPKKTGIYVADEFKYIARIGIFRSSALVLTGERENERQKTGDYFQAYNYDLKSGRKVKLVGFGGRVWRFLGFAKFDASPVPDIVFQYFDCTGCEATLFLGSFRYDGSTGLWRVRIWGPKPDDTLEIASDNQFGDDGVYGYDCAYRVGSFSDNGLEQVAVWCRETNLDKHKTDDWTQFYSSTEKPQLITVTAPEELKKLHAFVCATNRESKLCRSNDKKP